MTNQHVVDKSSRVKVPLLIAADIGHGNSGSPVLDQGGKVVGVVFALNASDTRQALAIPLQGLGAEMSGPSSL